MDEPLHSPETERALLACLIVDSDTLTGLDITANDFHILKNRQVFEVIDYLSRAGEAIDYITVCQTLDTKKQLAGIGGPAYVTSLCAAEAATWNAPAYAKILRDKARRRGLVTIAGQIAKAAYDETQPVDGCIPEFVNGLVTASTVRQGAEHIGGAMGELYDEVQERYQNPQDIWGISTGFPTFDKTTGGLQAGELMILAGVPGVGKSILGMDLAAGMAKHAPGAIYSMEMRQKQVARRLVSGYASVPTRNMKTGRMSEEELNRFCQAIDYFGKLPVYMADSQGWTTTSLRADLARLKALHGIQWFVLDYLYLLAEGGDDEIERTQNASKGLKRATMELNLAGIAIHSLNKTGISSSRGGDVGGDGLPNGLNDLRGSGQVAYDADLACFLTRYNKDAVSLQLSQDDQVLMKEHGRVLWFGKGRELENPRQYVPLKQKVGFPAFVEVEERRL